MSRHEAELARAEAERGRDECVPGGAERVCSESASVCALSDELRDRDADTRCLRSRETCEAARAHDRVHCR